MDNDIYVWGDNEEGQIGLGKSIDNCKQPTFLPPLGISLLDSFHESEATKKGLIQELKEKDQELADTKRELQLKDRQLEELKKLWNESNENKEEQDDEKSETQRKSKKRKIKN